MDELLKPRTDVNLKRLSINTGICAATFAVLTSCTSPEVVVETDQGPVTCQLYRESVTWWDKAVKKPDAMSEDAADNICKQEGIRRQGN